MFIIYFLISLFCSVFPFFVLPLPTWAVFIIALIEYFFPIIGFVISTVIWIWAAIVVFSSPFSTLTLIFIVVGILFIVMMIRMFVAKKQI